MATLKATGIAAALLITVPISAQPTADPVTRWQPLIAEASRRSGVPEAWIVAVMRAESGGRTMLHGHPIVSRAGAMGLMQLMPTTWADMRQRLGLGTDPHDPHDNIMAGSVYLRLMYNRFGYPGLFAAYNAGPARYAAHLASGRRLPGETQAYLATLAKAPSTPMMQPAIVSGERLFFQRSSGIAPDGRNRHAESLFVELSTGSDRK